MSLVEILIGVSVTTGTSGVLSTNYDNWTPDQPPYLTTGWWIPGWCYQIGCVYRRWRIRQLVRKILSNTQ